MRPRLRVLLVEDHIDTRLTLAHTLTLQGYEVISAADVKSGTAMGKAENFDILVCDIGLPDGLGWEILGELRETKSFPAIAISVYAADQDLAAHRKAGFDLAIPKPFDLPVLIQQIDELALNHAQRLTD